MKLKHKLIPLAIIGTTCSAVVPFVASCGNSDSGKMVDMLTRFVPTIEQHKKAELSMEDIYADYIKAVKDNPEVFIQDFYWYSSNWIIQYGKDRAKFHKLLIKDVVCDEYEVEGQEYKSIPLLSYTLEYEMEYKYQVDNETIRHYFYNGTSTYKNIPFLVEYSSSEGLWYWGASIDYLKDVEFAKDVDWSASIEYYSRSEYTVNDSIYGPYTYTVEKQDVYGITGDEVITGSVDEVDAANIATALEQDALYSSYYLYSVSWIGE